MLADVLDRTRDQVAEDLERRAAAIESTELPLAGRRKRLRSFVDDVIGALRRGGPDGANQPITPFRDSRLELRERDLVRRYLIEKVERDFAMTSGTFLLASGRRPPWRGPLRTFCRGRFGSVRNEVEVPCRPVRVFQTITKGMIR
jgi:hypothetical protein